VKVRQQAEKMRDSGSWSYICYVTDGGEAVDGVGKSMDDWGIINDLKRNKQKINS
jgi:hypothetical protein